MKRKNNKGITLISLVVTIIILIILAGVTIGLILGDNNNLIGMAKEGANKTNEQTATEKINLKITNSQMQAYAKEQRMPTLQELANDFCEDNEIQYVTLESKKVASLEKIDVGEATSIYTKLKDYPYEFEINNSLQLASIDGVKIANKNMDYKELYEELLKDYEKLSENKTQFVGMYQSATWVRRSASQSLTIKDVEPGTYTLIAFRTMSSGGNNEYHISFNAITSIDNASYSKIDTKNTVFKILVNEKNDITINFPPAASNDAGDGGYAYAYLFK